MFLSMVRAAHIRGAAPFVYVFAKGRIDVRKNKRRDNQAVQRKESGCARAFARLSLEVVFV